MDLIFTRITSPRDVLTIDGTNAQCAGVGEKSSIFPYIADFMYWFKTLYLLIAMFRFSNFTISNAIYSKRVCFHIQMLGYLRVASFSFEDNVKMQTSSSGSSAVPGNHSPAHEVEQLSFHIR